MGRGGSRTSGRGRSQGTVTDNNQTTSDAENSRKRGPLKDLSYQIIQDSRNRQAPKLYPQGGARGFWILCYRKNQAKIDTYSGEGARPRSSQNDLPIS